MNACHTPCPCWQPGPATAGAHDGHCCLLRDRRSIPPVDDDWRADDTACEPPTSADEPQEVHSVGLGFVLPDSPTNDDRDDEPVVQEPPC